MAADVLQAKIAEDTVRGALKSYDQIEQRQEKAALDRAKAIKKVELAADRMSDLAEQAIGSRELDDDDRNRMERGLRTRGLKSYKEKYPNKDELHNILGEYSRNAASLGFEPPRVSGEVAGGNFRYLRNGSLSDLNNSIVNAEMLKQEKKRLFDDLQDAVVNADEYKQAVEVEEARILNMSAVTDEDKFLKEYVLNELNNRKKYWDKVKKFVKIETDDDGNMSFKNLGYVSDSITGNTYGVDKVYFDDKKREYVLEIIFDNITDDAEALNISNYQVDGLFFDTIKYAKVTIPEILQQLPTDDDYSRVVLTTKFGIIPNKEYLINVYLSDVNESSQTFIRRVGPKVESVVFYRDNEIHVGFTADIDIELEGVREETELFLNSTSVSNLENYKIVDIDGNEIGIGYAYVAADQHTISIVLDEPMQHMMGYTISIQNIYYDNGALIKEENGKMDFMFSVPYPVFGVVGEYDTTTRTVVLTWVPSVNDEIGGYNVYRADNDLPFVKMNDIVIADGERYMDITVLGGNKYKYCVTVVDLSGEESAKSEVFEVFVQK